MILKIAFDQPTRKAFDYFGVEGDGALPVPGTRVLAKLGSSERVGIVVEVSERSDLPIAKIRHIERALDGGRPVLTEPVARAVRQFSESNVLPVGKLAFAALPPAARRSAKDLSPPEVAPRPKLEVSPAEGLKGRPAKVLEELVCVPPGFKPHLVCGSPGTGKTEMCVEAVAAAVRNGNTCLVLVPEVSSIEGWVARLGERMPGLVARSVHGGLRDRERMEAWWTAMLGGCHVVVGSRSAVTVPLADLGLVCVVNENSPLFRPDRGLVFSARDMAAVRARAEGCPLLLSSATPSLELRHAAHSQRMEMTMLAPEAGRTKQSIQIVDIANRRLFGGVSVELENALKAEIQRGGQSAVLVNRRGRYGFLYCADCRLRLTCRHCGHLLSSHGEGACQCRRCSRSQAMPDSCPGCGGGDIVSMRPGSVRVAESLATRLPEARIYRVDPDRDHGEVMEELRAERPDVVVGSSFLGLDLEPGTCCVSDADSILFSHNFRAAEHLIDVLTRLTAMGPEVNLLVQTRFATHHVFEALRQGSYDTFAFAELAERKSAGLSPYRRLALFRATGEEADSVAQAVGSAKYLASECMPRTISILEPVPAPAKRKAASTMQLLINSPDRKSLQESVGKWASLLEQQPMPGSVSWDIEIDPETW